MVIAKDFLGNVIEAGNTIAYAINKDSLVLFKVLDIKPDGRLVATRLEHNPNNTTSPPLGMNYHPNKPELYHDRAVKLWLSFEEDKK